MIDLPVAFQQQMQAQLGTTYPDFLAALEQTPPVSIRQNLKKIPAAHQLPSEKVLWHNQGYYLPERPIFTLDPTFHGGAYYVQEAASMFLAEVVRQQVDLARPLHVLDLCAAPGGKTTLLASLLNEESLLVANEVIRSRYQILLENCIKWGYPNVVVTNHDPADFKSLNGFFDLVLVDAPCSGEGLFRKDQKARSEWSPKHVTLCSARQKRILAAAQALVKSGGHLIYCTCTYNSTENIENVQWLEREFGLQTKPLALQENWGIATIGDKTLGYQLYPHQVRGEGFFISILRQENDKKVFSPTKTAKLPLLSKKRQPDFNVFLHDPTAYTLIESASGTVDAFPKILQDAVAQIQTKLKRSKNVLELGRPKGKAIQPAPALALSHAIHPNLPSVELTRQQVLKYLKKEPIDVQAIPLGWHLVQYNEIYLGWIKALKNRFNNYYPKNWRIRMALDN